MGVRDLWRKLNFIWSGGVVNASEGSPRAIFEDIYRNNTWGGDKGQFYSGSGSHDPLIVDVYIEAIEHMIGELGGRLDVVDLGCGDFNVGSRLRSRFRRYVACDVVRGLIEYNKEKFKSAKVKWKLLDIVRDSLPAGDICLIRQVLQHLNNDQIAAIVGKLKQYRYIVVTEHLPSGEFSPNIDKPIGSGTRMERQPPSGIILTAPPFFLKPIEERVIAESLEFGGIIRSTFYRNY